MLSIVKEFISYTHDQNWKLEPVALESSNAVSSYQFDKGNLHFLFICDESRDPNFFQILLPYIDDFSQEKKDIVDLLTREYKAGKVVVLEGNRVCLSMEQLVFSESNINLLFERVITILENMYADYRNRALALRNNANNL